jgi:hypothetical protein
MVQRHAALWAAIHVVTKGPHVSDGNPRAQAKLEAKIKNLGVLTTNLKPGKRGRYELRVYSLAGWDPQRDDLIETDDPIPKKPWICTLLHIVRGEGHGWVSHESFSPVIFLTHHCLSRSAQRWGVRTVDDLSAVIKKIIKVTIAYLYKRSLSDKVAGDDARSVARFDTPPEGVRLPIPGDTGPEDTRQGENVIVLKKHETRDALVAVTVLD